jgi:FkbM family methyltransferase
MDEAEYDLEVARKLHVVDASKWLGADGRAFWLEWSHPLEQPRKYAQIIDGLEKCKWPRFIKPGSVAIDIGAHSGDTTIPMGLFGFDKATGRKCKVIAVEPNPALEPLLKACLALNAHVADFVYRRVAVTPRDMEAIELSDHGNANCNGGVIGPYSSELSATLRERAKVTYTAPGMTIDSLLRAENIDPADVTFIKTDCEGYDKEILRGAKDFLRAVRPALFIEWFDWFTPEDDADLFRVIDEIGYAPFRPGSLAPLDRAAGRISDIFCLPKP